MRSPLCSDCGEICPEDQGIGSESDSSCKILAIEKSYEKCHTYRTAIFGIGLENLMGTTPQVAPRIPFILSRLCRYIEQHGLHYKHLFLEDAKDLVESLKFEFNESGDAPLEAAGNVASVAKLLIIFFEELPEPLIPITSQPDFIKGMEKLTLNAVDCVVHLKQSLSKLPASAYEVLKYLSRFLFHVASHKEYNGMSSDNLSIIFGPVIFRLSSSDSSMLTNVKNVMNHLVQNYHSVFDDDHKCSSCDEDINQISNAVASETCLRRQIPCPSTVVPVMTLMPLSVVIPSVDSDMTNDKKSKGSIPVLLIEGQHDGSQKVTEGKHNVIDVVKENNAINRKRKERRLSGEDSQQRSSSEERPAPLSLTSADKIDLMRRCNSHEEMKEDSTKSDVKIEPRMSQEFSEKNAHNLDCYASDSVEMVTNEKNHSPHPPYAKRREIESVNLDYNFLTHSWMDSSKFDNLDTTDSSSVSDPENSNLESKQNSIAEIEATNFMDCDASENNESHKEDYSLINSDAVSKNQISSIPRSSSFPVPISEKNSEGENSSLSLSWSMLFESPDSEPLRSEHRYSWPLTKEVQEDTALLSPTVQSLRKSTSFNEAPLSPSAYRSYLSHRSSHLDPSVPPSPPVEQEDFAKNLIESNAVSDVIKQLTKKIHSIKKRIRKFDEKFEMEFGYKPSHAEKANHPEAKKLMNDLHKTRKDLKALKDESYFEQVSPANWHSSKSSHILGDSTNHVNRDANKLKPSVEETYGVAMKSLADERKVANRPDCVDDMTNDQVKDEKFAIQRALLDFESIHGKPCSKQERNTIRPLYDRYRSVKKLLVRSGSFPGGMSKSKDVCTELQPILEHETMDFTSPQHRTEIEVTEQIEESTIPEPEVPIEALKSTYSLDNTKHTHVLALKYDNSNIHELPLSEMVFQLQQVKSQKRHLRKILREFESEFLRLNGRKVSKEDKAPVDALYVEYKHVKARLKLLEALISKHDQHQLM